MGYLVHRAVPEDVKAIGAVARETWAATYRGIIPEEIQAAVLPQWYAEEPLVAAAANPASAFFVAETESGRSSRSPRQGTARNQGTPNSGGSMCCRRTSAWVSGAGCCTPAWTRCGLRALCRGCSCRWRRKTRVAGARTSV